MEYKPGSKEEAQYLKNLIKKYSKKNDGED